MTTTDLPLRQPWWSVESLEDGVSWLYEPAVHPLLQGNAFFVRGSDADLLVDAGTGIAPLRDRLEGADLIGRGRPVIAVATHAHYDHVGCMYEFETRLIHPAEAEELIEPTEEPTLFTSRSDPEFIALVRRLGMDLPELLIDAVPDRSFDPDTYGFPNAPATGSLEEGDSVELGNRTFAVLHLPGHSPGSIGLLEERTGIFFAGDLVYDDVLITEGPGTDLADYVASMERVRDLEISTVHGGHGASFDQTRLEKMIEEFLRSCESSGP